MFGRNKKKTELEERLEKLEERVHVTEYIITKLIEQMEEVAQGVANDTKIQEVLAEKVLDNRSKLESMLKVDEDRIKAINLTMDKVAELDNSLKVLAQILNQKGYISIEDFKGD